MAGEQHPYNNATFGGEHFNFPVKIAGPLPTRVDYYRQTEHRNRSFDEYCTAFGINLEIFAGMRVLDLGAGMEDRFGQEASERGLTVASVNPNWKNTIEKEDILFPPFVSSFTGNGHAISAIAQELPFKDESFQVVLSLCGIPEYLPGTKGEYRRAFQEVERVLAPGGMAIMFPISRTTYEQPAFREVLDACFEDCRFPDERGIPKLFAIKQGGEERAPLYDYLADCMARRD